MSLFDKINEWLTKLGEQLSGGESSTEQNIAKSNPVEQNEAGLAQRNQKDAPLNTDGAEKNIPLHENNTEKEQRIEDKDSLLDNVVDFLAELSDDVNFGMGNRLVIWLDTDDELLFKSYATPQYRQQIQSRLWNEYDFKFNQVELCMGRPEKGGSPVGKSGMVFLQIVEEIPVQTLVSRKAVISIYGDAGSLVKKRYTLSSDEMKEKMIESYNIGSGEFPQVPTGYRENHIAIDDNINNPMIEKNKYVSRKHAHIGFSEKFGFYLQVELDGTRLMGKRTRIFRGEQIIEMDNPKAKEPLQSGDLIELGKAVILRYVEINN